MKTTSMNLDLVASTGNQMSTGKTNVQSAGKTSGGSFDLIMNQAQNFGHKQSEQAVNMASTKKETKDSSFTTQNNSQSADNKGTSATVENKDMNNSLNESSVDTDQTVVGAYAEELRGKLQEVLGLTDEEMEELLASMGLVTMDLLNPENLMNVVLEQFNAASTAEALVNEGLSNALLESSKLLEDIVSKIQKEIIDFGTEDASDMKSFDEILATAGADETEVKTKENEEQLDLDKTIDETVGKEIAVEVHKETESGKESFSFAREDREQHKDTSSTGDTFVDYFANKVDLSSIQTDEMTIQDAKQIVTQLVDQIKLNISQTKTSMEMILNPEALGKVQVVVQNKEGVLTAHLKVENEIAKQALETSLQTLKESFENQGLKVEKVEVTIGNYSQEYAEQQGKEDAQGNQGSKKKINVDEYFEEGTEATEEASTTPIASMTGTVEYTA